MPDTKHPTISRRALLRAAGQGLVTVAALPALLERALAADAPTPKKLGYAVVGLGSFALNQILPSFAASKGSKVVALVSGHRDKAEWAAGRFGVDLKNIYNYQNYDKLKDNPDVDVIYVILPNGLHAEYVVRGAKAGKHIFCEKPIANTVAEAEQMIAACKEARRKLMIGYRCQYEPNNLAASALARSGELGPTQSLIIDHGFNIGPNQWRLNKKLAGGGSLVDIGIYSLQAARYLTGEEPVEVSAQLSSPPNDPRFKEVEATVHFLLRFPGGALANCTSSYSYVSQSHIRVVGSKGWLELEPATAYDGIRLRVSHNYAPPEDRTVPEINQFAAERDHFSQCILNNKEPKTPGEEGLRDMKLMAAIYEAARTGKTVKVG